MPLKAFTLFKTAPRIFPDVVSTIGPEEAPLISAALAFTRTVAAPAALPRKERRLIMCTKNLLRLPRTILQLAAPRLGAAYWRAVYGRKPPRSIAFRAASASAGST